MSVHHSKVTPEWGTPHHITALARYTLGTIELDAASSPYWNEHTVEAPWFSTADDSALDGRWDHRVSKAGVFCNPPGGLVKEFWAWSMAIVNIHGASVFWVGFSLNQLTYLGRMGVWSQHVRVAVPTQRLRYLRAVAGGPPVPGDAPPHGSYLVLLSHDERAHGAFETACAEADIPVTR